MHRSQSAEQFIAAIARYGRPERVADTERFFKAYPGGYSEGDEFIAAGVPNTRLVCKQFRDLPQPEVQKLLDSPIHDYRLGAVIILAERYKRARDDAERQAIFDLYLKNVRRGRINNWDIIDTTAEHVIGAHEQNTNRALLFELAKSKDVWHKRTAIMSAFYFVKRGDPTTTLALAEKLLHDKHDLIQKAVGWQLREVGKRVDRTLLTDFLDKHAATMPRTTLRYAVEHLPLAARSHYMQMKNR